MIVVGIPFVEILKIARDLDLPMIIMGVRGRSTPPEEILFGSTAEKVLRGTRIPVLCVPY
jgi:nucleotide-binding universal stress UspA family protein